MFAGEHYYGFGLGGFAKSNAAGDLRDGSSQFRSTKETCGEIGSSRLYFSKFALAQEF